MLHQTKMSDKFETIFFSKKFGCRHNFNATATGREAESA